MASDVSIFVSERLLDYVVYKTKKRVLIHLFSLMSVRPSQLPCPTAPWLSESGTLAFSQANAKQNTLVFAFGGLHLLVNMDVVTGCGHTVLTVKNLGSEQVRCTKKIAMI